MGVMNVGVFDVGLRGRVDGWPGGPVVQTPANHGLVGRRRGLCRAQEGEVASQQRLVRCKAPPTECQKGPPSNAKAPKPPGAPRGRRLGPTGGNTRR